MAATNDAERRFDETFQEWQDDIRIYGSQDTRTQEAQDRFHSAYDSWAMRELDQHLI